MEKNSSDGGGLVLGLILLALGGAIVKKIVENNTSHQDFIDSNLPDLKNIPGPVIPEVKVFPLNRQLTHRKKENRVIDVRKVVRPSPLPYHLEKGWKKERKIYLGYYRCRLGAFRGQIEERFSGDYKFYIFDPPQQALNGSHKACFTIAGIGRYHIHFGVNSEDLDSGIMAVERLLYQSLKRR